MSAAEQNPSPALALGELPVTYTTTVEDAIALARAADRERHHCVRRGEAAARKGYGAAAADNREAAGFWRAAAERLFAVADAALVAACPRPDRIPPLRNVTREEGRWSVRMVGGARVWIAEAEPPRNGTWVQLNGRPQLVHSSRRARR